MKNDVVSKVNNLITLNQFPLIINTIISELTFRILLCLNLLAGFGALPQVCWSAPKGSQLPPSTENSLGSWSFFILRVACAWKTSIPLPTPLAHSPRWAGVSDPLPGSSATRLTGTSQRMASLPNFFPSLRRFPTTSPSPPLHLPHPSPSPPLTFPIPPPHLPPLTAPPPHLPHSTPSPAPLPYGFSRSTVLISHWQRNSPPKVGV